MQICSSITLEHHALGFLVRIAFHLVHANANVLFNAVWELRKKVTDVNP